MDWSFAIDRNKGALLRIVAMLLAAAGLSRGEVVPTLPRRVRNLILFALRPAESAVRRLIALQVRTTDIAPGRARTAPTAPIPKGEGRADHVPAFPLADRRKCFAERRRRMSSAARITSLGYVDPVFAAPQPDPTPDDALSARQLCLRLEMLFRALEDLPKQARRFVRAEARRKQAPPGPRRVPLLRPGWPPGYRQRHKHPVDEVLYHCHCLARQALIPPRRTG